MALHTRTISLCAVALLATAGIARAQGVPGNSASLAPVEVRTGATRADSQRAPHPPPDVVGLNHRRLPLDSRCQARRGVAT